MPTCREIAAQATDYAEGHLALAERSRWEGHVAGCPGCATYARQLAVAGRAAAALPEPELPLALRQRLLAGYDERAARQAGAAAPRPSWLAPFSALAVLAAFAVLLLPARRPSRSAADWGAALALVALAAILGARGGRAGWGVVALAASAAGAAALLGGGEGPLHALAGLDCLASELGAVAGTAGAMWLVLRRGPGALARTPLGALAVAGALAGAAALQITCGAHGSTAHALAFHLGGVVLVAAAAALLPRPRPEAA